MQNRYATIHVLFKVLADKLEATNPAKFEFKGMGETKEKVKTYWKGFFGVNSLTDMDDEELKNLESMLKKRIESIPNSKTLESK